MPPTRPHCPGWSRSLIALTLGLALLLPAIPAAAVAPARPPAPPHLTEPGRPPAHAFAPAEDPSLRVDVYWDSVSGYVAPNAKVQCRVYGPALKGSGEGRAKADGWLDYVSCGADIVPGDRVYVRADVSGAQLFETVLYAPGVEARLEPSLDRITGRITTSYALPLQAVVWVWSDGRRAGADVAVTIAADGTFVADFSQQFDILVGDSGNVWLTPGPHWIGAWLPATFMHVIVDAENWVHVQGPRNTPFTLTVQGKATLTSQTNADGWTDTLEQDQWQPARPTILPGDVVTLKTAVVEKRVDPVREITIDLNEIADVVTGRIGVTGRSGLRVTCEPWVDNAPTVEAAFDPWTGSYRCDMQAVGWDVKKSEPFSVRYIEPDSDNVVKVRPGKWDPWAAVNITNDSFGGWFGAGVAVDYTAKGPGGQLKATARGVTRDDGWMDEIWVDTDLRPGDTVHAVGSNGYDATFTLLDIAARVDPDADRVTGRVQGITAEMGAWINISGPFNRWASRAFTVQPGADFTVDFGPDFDLRLGEAADIWVVNDASGTSETGGYFRTLSASVNTGGNYVDVYTAANAAFEVVVEGQARLTGMADRRGEAHSWQDPWRYWAPAPPDIEPQDTVTVTSNGFTLRFSPVGRIDAAANLAADTITGRVAAPGITENVRVRCSMWIPSGPTVDAIPATVSPDGGAFTCDFRSAGWDLRPGQLVDAWFTRPDGNDISNSFWTQSQVYLPLLLR